MSSDNEAKSALANRTVDVGSSPEVPPRPGLETHQKKRILFVDDERRLLDGLRRLLRGHRRQCDMHFAISGQEGLEVLEQVPVDVVVSDMRMPGMTGAEFLEIVRQRHPATVRLILSGQCDERSMLQAVEPAHQFLSKPCNSEALRTTVARVSDLKNRLKNDAIRSRVSSIVSLPCHPRTLDELRSECEKPDPSLEIIGRIAASDMAVTAKLVQLVSSGFFGSPRPVADAAAVIRLLGLDVIRPLVLETAAFQAMDASPRVLELLDLFNRVHHACGQAGRAIAEAEGADQPAADQIYLACTMANIGMLVLAADNPEYYVSLLEKAVARQMALRDVEQEVYQTTRNEAGAYLLGLWGFAPPILDAVQYVEAPGAAPATSDPLLRAIVHVVSHTMDRELADLIGRPIECDLDYLETIGKRDRLPVWQEICQNYRVAEVPA